MPKIKQNILCLMSAFLSLWALTSMLKLDAGRYPISNSVFSVVLFVGLFWLIRAAYLRINKRLAVVSGVFGFFFSAFMICGANILQRQYAFLNKPFTWLRILAGTPLFMALIVMILTTLPKWNAVTKISKLENFSTRVFGWKKVFFISWLLILLAWVPGLIASFPGIYAYDSVYQIGYYLSGSIYLHHPLIHTYLLGFCVVTLGNLFGSPEIGMLVYSLFQMLCLSATFAAICYYMARRNTSVLIRAAFLLIFMFLPVNALMSFSATKDVIFSALFALMILGLLLIAENPSLLKKNLFCLVCVLVTFFMMIFRSQGIYIFFFGMIFCFIWLRKQWKRVLAIFSACVVLFLVYSGPITTLCKGKKFDGLREMMSIPCMQLSRVMLYAPDKLTAEEKEIIEDYIPGYKHYSTFTSISDSMKNTFNAARFREKPGEFIKLWARIGLRCPTTYIDAFLRITVGLWYPDMNYRDPGAYHPYWEYISTQQNAQGSFFIVERTPPSGMEWLSNFYDTLTYKNSYQKIPIISMLFSSGFMVWIVFLYIAWCLYQRKYRYLVPASFLVALWLTLLLGPVVLYRYVYPIVMSVPLLISFVLTEESASKERTNQ